MIKSFLCADTDLLHAGQRVARFVNIERVAVRKLKQLQLARCIEDLRVPPGNRLEALRGDRAGFGLTSNGGFVLRLPMVMRMRSKLLIIIKEKVMRREITPITPGEMLLEEFLIPMGLSQYALAKAIAVAPRRINEIVHGRRAITADTDLRLCKFFGLSDGWWLSLQADYDTERAREAMSEVLARIMRYQPASIAA